MKKTYEFNDKKTITIDFENAVIDSIVLSNEEIIYGSIPFYAIKLRKKNGKSKIITGNRDNFVSYDNNVAQYVHKEVRVEIKIRKEKSSLIWRINIENKTNHVIEWAEVMSFGVFGKLCDEKGGQGKVVFPYNEGVLVTDMSKRNTSPFPYIEPEYPSLGKYSIFPNMISSQFLSYITGNYGIYMGMHDEERTTKHIDFCMVDGNIKLQMRTFCDVEYGEDYKMPFDSVIELFEGDWYDACEIYRKWFYKHIPEGLKKIEDSLELPKWYGESPVIITYPIRGEYDTDEMIPNCFYPYKNAISYLREFSEKTGSKIMSLLMHWEGTAPWAPPYVWPPYGGENEFNEFVEKMHNEGMLVGVYCSGMGWTQQSNLIQEYNCKKQFEKQRLDKIMCSNSDGTIKSEICKEQRMGYDLCPACQKTKNILESEIKKVVNSGVDYVQAFDQNHGGSSYFCYSSEHGHKPAPGKWQVKETIKIMRNIHKEGVLIGCESAAAEPFISQLKFSDNRYELNYYIGLPIPIYSYIYHEYVNNFMGNQICMMLSKEEYNYPYRLAYSFIAGDMLTVVMINEGEIAYCWGNECFRDHVNKEQAIKLIKNLNEWRRKEGKSFLHLGKMVKPLKILCGTNDFIGEDGRRIVVDKVLTAAYEYKGERLQFAVNYNDLPEIIKVEKPVTIYKNAQMTEKVENIVDFEIPALTAIAFR